MSYIFFGVEVELAWLDPGISQDYQLSEYVTNHLNVEEIRPEAIIPRLSLEFLQGQSDDWIRRLYEFLHDQRAQVQRVGLIPVVRLEGGVHVRAKIYGQVQAYLPTGIETGFPTVARSVCDSTASRQFLRSLGLSEPDAVDDVLINLIPKYTGASAEIDDDEYAADIRRILNAYGASAGEQSGRLIDALRKTAFVKLVDLAAPDSRTWGLPSRAYLPTEELTELFSGITGVWFVDRTYSCLCGEKVDLLLEACGSLDRLSAVQVNTEARFSWGELLQMRIKTQGNNGSTRGQSVMDWRIRGLDSLLSRLSKLHHDDRSRKARLLWKSLSMLDRYHFSGRYRWFYYTNQSCTFQPEFVELLNKTAWVPTTDGNLAKPSTVVFDDLGWEENSFLQSRVLFKPSTIRVLAEEAGFQPELLDLLKSRGVTTVTQLLEVVGELPDGDQDSGSLVEVSPDTHNTGVPFAVSSPSVDSVASLAVGYGSAALEQSGDSTAGAGGVNPPGVGPDQAAAHPDSPEVSFAASLYAVQTISPSNASGNSFVPPVGGPMTPQSARNYTGRSVLLGQTEADVLRTVTISELGPEGRELAEEFRDMVEGDYGKRCQICSRTFQRAGGGWQVNVVHVVPLRTDRRANHFGDLLGLCGWHFNLMQHGEWSLLDPVTDRPFENSEESRGWELMRSFILSRAPGMDDLGNPFVGLPVRFSNVYQDWEADPATIDEEIRYSIPHWEFLGALLSDYLKTLVSVQYLG